MSIPDDWVLEAAELLIRSTGGIPEEARRLATVATKGSLEHALVLALKKVCAERPLLEVCKGALTWEYRAALLAQKFYKTFGMTPADETLTLLGMPRRK